MPPCSRRIIGPPLVEGARRVTPRKGAVSWACLFLVCLACSCNRTGTDDTTEVRERDGGRAEESIVPVKVIRPSRGDIVQSIQATTSIEAKRQVIVNRFESIGGDNHRLGNVALAMLDPYQHWLSDAHNL